MTTTTPRDRVWQAIRHVEPDRVPYHFSFTAPARRKLQAYYDTDNLDEILDNHLVKYKPRSPDAWREVRPDFWRDEFGVVWNRTVDKDIGVVQQYQLKRRSLDGFTFPDPHDPRRYEGLPGFVEAHADRFRVINLGFSLFERAWTLRSMPELMVDMLEAPAFVDELLDNLAEFNLAIIETVRKT